MRRETLSIAPLVALACNAGVKTADAGCPPLPSGVSYVDPRTPDGTEPDTTACSRIVRVASTAATPKVASMYPGKINASFTYLVRTEDGAVVMIDGGFSKWITGGTPQAPVVEENVELRDALNKAVAALAPGKSLKDVAAVYFEHGHPDHTMQAEWIQKAKGAPLDVWMGEGDVPLVQSRQAAQDCTGQLPPGAVPFLPIYTSPDYVVHAVPASGDWVDGGHGVRLIPAPSHTRGTILVFVPSLNVVVASNHLRRGDDETKNDCALDVSLCKAPCTQYGRASRAIPPGARVLHVHREDLGG